MTRRGALLLPFPALLLCCALATGAPAYYFLFATFAVTYLYSMLTALLLKGTLRAAYSCEKHKVLRGENAAMTLETVHRCPLPVSAARAEISFGSGHYAASFAIAPFRKETTEISLPASHVGVFSFAAERIILEDLFGLFRVRVRPAGNGGITVLPVPFELARTDSLGENGEKTQNRAREDYASPEDVRAYMPGDALKRIHWKLSSQRRELVVRRFETPSPPDTLILMDPSAPLVPAGDPENAAEMRDTLCETCLTAAQVQLRGGCPVRIPLYGEGSAEFVSDREDRLPLLQEMLARQRFEKDNLFPDVLRVESGHIRKAGAVILITTELTAESVDTAGRIRRAGPNVRLYLLTFQPEEAEKDPLVERLQNYYIQVCFVTP